MYVTILAMQKSLLDLFVKLLYQNRQFFKHFHLQFGRQLADTPLHLTGHIQIENSYLSVSSTHIQMET